MRLEILMFFNMFILKEMILNGYEWFRLRIWVMSWSWNSFELKFITFLMWFYVTEPFKFFSMRWTVLKCPKNSQSDGKFWKFLVGKMILGRIGVAWTWPIDQKRIPWTFRRTCGFQFYSIPLFYSLFLLLGRNRFPKNPWADCIFGIRWIINWSEYILGLVSL